MKKYASFLGEKKMIKDQGLMRHEEIRKQIQILPELEALIPPLLEDEYKQLEENILNEGCREALLIWETQLMLPGDPPDQDLTVSRYVLIDGHNRFSICRRNNLDFKIHILHFDGLSEVRDFMIDNQLGRRNLSPEQMAYLRGKKYNALKLEKGKYDRLEHKGQNDPYDGDDKLSTSAKLAKQFNVSEKTIKRDAAYAEGLDTLPLDVKRDVLSGKQKIKKSEIQQLRKSGKGAGTTGELIAVAQDGIAGESEMDKVSELKTKLTELVKKLSKNPKQPSRICDEIISYAIQLRNEVE